MKKMILVISLMFCGSAFACDTISPMSGQCVSKNKYELEVGCLQNTDPEWFPTCAAILFGCVTRDYCIGYPG